ncbi:mucin-19-like [Sycon ciliatum]|uniref:mucin-19-like n=1 Tax=Sycon ciliatum TaxID=27933 RepID=UPI0031F7044B
MGSPTTLVLLAVLSLVSLHSKPCLAQGQGSNPPATGGSDAMTSAAAIPSPTGSIAMAPTTATTPNPTATPSAATTSSTATTPTTAASTTSTPTTPAPTTSTSTTSTPTTPASTTPTSTTPTSTTPTSTTPASTTPAPTTPTSTTPATTTPAPTTPTSTTPTSTTPTSTTPAPTTPTSTTPAPTTPAPTTPTSTTPTSTTPASTTPAPTTPTPTTSASSTATTSTTAATFATVPAVACTPPTSPTNGQFSQGAFNTGDTLTLSCNSGYTLLGSDTWTCQANGTVTSGGSCIRQCKRPIDPANGAYSLGSFNAVQSILTLSCNPDHRLYGTRNATCASDGVVAGTGASTCERICMRPADPANGAYSPGPFDTRNSTLTLSCNTNYRVSGTGSVTCVSDGTVAGAGASTCELVTCARPANPANGVYSTGSFTAVQNTLTLTCSTGYTLAGSATATCGAGGSVTGDDGVCNVVTCARPANPANGVYSTGSFTAVQNTLTLTCSTGYTLAGSATATCGAGGLVTGDDGVCNVVTCARPANPANGVYSTGSFTAVQNTLTLTCSTGYTLAGSATATCGAGGSVTGDDGVCNVVTCARPANPANGVYSTGSFTAVQNTLTLTCSTGYTLAGSATATCGAGGLVTGDDGVCNVVTCARPANPANGVYSTGSFTAVQNTLTLTCSTGYTLAGSATATCGAGGSVTGDDGVCNVVTCARPANPANGVYSTGSFTAVQNTLTLTCTIGYNLTGSATATCNANGSVTGDDGVCDLVTCARPANPANGVYSTGSFTAVQNTLTLTCSTGYTLAGSATATCGAGGLVTGDDGVCNVIIPIESAPVLQSVMARTATIEIPAVNALYPWTPTRYVINLLRIETSNVTLSTPMETTVDVTNPDRSTVVTKVLRNLSPASHYSITVLVDNSTSLSQRSPVLNVSTLPEASGAPDSPAVDAQMATSFRVSFPQLDLSLHHGQLTGYQIEYTAVQRSGVTLPSAVNLTEDVGIPVVSTASVSAVVSTSVTPATRYTVRVRAVNSVGAGILSQLTIVTTLESVPGKPQKPTQDAITTRSILLNIPALDLGDRHGMITKYSIKFVRTQVSGIAVSGPGETKSVDVSVSTPGMQRQYNYTMASPASLYTITMTATNGAGAGPDSDPIMVTTLADLPVNVPTPSASTTLGTTRVTIPSLGLMDRNGAITMYKLCYVLTHYGREAVNTSEVCIDEAVSAAEQGSPKILSLGMLAAGSTFNLTLEVFNAAGSAKSTTPTSYTTPDAAPARAYSAIEFSRGANFITAFITQPNVTERNGVIGRFLVTAQRIVPRTIITATSVPVALPTGQDMVHQQFTLLHAHSIYTITVQACQISDSLLCSQEALVNVTTLSKVADEAPALVLKSASSNTTFKSNITATFDGSTLNEARIHGIITKYEAVLYKDGVNISSQSVNVTHSIGEQAPSATVTFSDLQPYTEYTLRSLVFTASLFNSTVTHVSALSQVYRHTTAETRPEAAFSNASFRSVTRHGFQLCFVWPEKAERHGALTSFNAFYRLASSAAGTAYVPTPILTAGTNDMTCGKVGGALTPNTQYTVRAEACTSVGCSDVAAVGSIYTATTAPSQSTAGAITSTTNQTAVTLTFQRPAPAQTHGDLNAFTFAFSIVSVNGVPTTKIANGRRNVLAVANTTTTFTFTFGQLEQGAFYQGTVTACTRSENSGLDQCSENATTVFFNTTESAPDVSVSSMSATAVEKGKLTVRLSPPSILKQNGYITRYMVSYSSELATLKSTVEVVPLASATLNKSFELAGLLHYQLYTIEVRSCTAAGCATTSNATTGRTLSSAPVGPVRNLKLQNDTATASGATFMLLFDPVLYELRNSIITRYQIALKNASGAVVRTEIQAVGPRPNDRVTHSISGLIRYHLYTVVVTPENTDSELGPSVNITGLSVEGVPTAVTALSFCCVQFSSAAVQWRDPVNYFGIPIGFQVAIAPAVQPKRRIAVTLRNVSFARLDAYSTYTVTVAAETGKGEGAQSSTTFRTCQHIPARDPQPTAVETMSRSLNITWVPVPLKERRGIISSYEVKAVPSHYLNYSVAPPTITIHRVQARTVSSDPVTNCSYIRDLVDETAGALYYQQIVGLHPGTSYNVSIRSCTVAGCSSAPTSVINVARFVTSSEAPAAGVRQVIVNATATSVSISWQPPKEEQQFGRITAYRVSLWASDRLAKSKNQNDNLSLTINTTNLHANISNLSPFFTYSYSVIAENIAGVSPSEVGTFQTSYTNPLKPLSIRVAMASGQIDRAVVTWSPPAIIYGIITEYQVLRKAVKTISVNGQERPLNDTGYQKLPVNATDGFTLNRQFSLETPVLHGATDYTFEVIAYIGDLASAGNSVFKYTTPPRAPPAVALPSDAPPVSVPSDRVRPLFPGFSPTSGLLLKLPAVDETNGPIKYYEVQVSPACDGKHTDAAPVPYTEFLQCTTCPCPPYIALYGTRKEVAVKVDGQYIIAIGSPMPPSSCNNICDPYLEPGKAYRVVVAALTFGPAREVLEQDFSSLAKGRGTTVAAATYSTNPNVKSGAGSGAIIGSVVAILLVAVAVAMFVWYRHTQPGSRSPTIKTRNVNISGKIETLRHKIGRSTVASRSNGGNWEMQTNANAPSSFFGSVTSITGEHKGLTAESKMTLVPNMQLGSAMSTKDAMSVCSMTSGLVTGVLPVEDSTLSKPIDVKDMRIETKTRSANDDLLFAEEFEVIKTIGANQPANASRLEVNKPKNRYTNILAYDHSRVALAPRSTDSDYVNANFVHGHQKRNAYIACQGPLPNTAVDFWQLIWENKCPVIVMVTQLVERARAKCHMYWPTSLQAPIEMGDLTVTMLEEDTSCADWHVRKLVISDGTRKHVVKHFAFQAWPDHGVPSTSDVLVRFIFTVRQNTPSDTSAPLCVHCSAGVGRTGTYICMDTALYQLVQNRIDIFGIVCAMRTQRNLMVQTEAQYVFLYKAMDAMATKFLTVQDNTPGATGAESLNHLAMLALENQPPSSYI